MAYISSTGIGWYALYGCISTTSLVDDRITTGYRGKMVSAGIKGLLNTNIYRRQAGIGDGSGDGVTLGDGHRDRINIIAQRIKNLDVLRIPILSTCGTRGAIAI